MTTDTDADGKTILRLDAVDMRHMYKVNRRQYLALSKMVAENLIDKHDLGEVPCGLSVNIGWVPIVDRCLQELHLGRGQLIEVKQKFCQLVVYVIRPDLGTWARQEAALIVAEKQADITCEVCGGPRPHVGIASGVAACPECEAYWDSIDKRGGGSI